MANFYLKRITKVTRWGIFSSTTEKRRKLTIIIFQWKLKEQSDDIIILHTSKLKSYYYLCKIVIIHAWITIALEQQREVASSFYFLGRQQRENMWMV
jgi:hypothetical protein